MNERPWQRTIILGTYRRFATTGRALAMVGGNTPGKAKVPGEEFFRLGNVQETHQFVLLRGITICRLAVCSCLAGANNWRSPALEPTNTGWLTASGPGWSSDFQGAIGDLVQ